MAVSENTKLVLTVLATGAGLLAAIGWAVNHLTDLQTEMENRLSANITASEGRVTQRIDEVDKRLTDNFRSVATDLRMVEGETAPLAGLEIRLTETIQASETRLSREVQGAEKRLTARIDKIDDRLLEVEGESARLSAIVKSRWFPSEVNWPLEAGKISEFIIGDTSPIAGLETLEAMKKAGLNVQWMGKPVRYQVTNQPLLEAYRQTLQKHPKLAEEVVQTYTDLVRIQLGLKAGDPATDTPADAESE